MITISKLKEYAKDIKVLYVEDEKGIRDEIHDFLSRFFPVIELAENGIEGLEKYQNESYEIVITDINMPKMNGIDMIHEIRQINEEQKIVVTSAYNEPEYLMKLIEDGVDSFVLKPFNNKKFLVVLYKICEFIYNKKQQHILQKHIIEKAAETQTILDMVEHAIIVIDKGDITHANQHFFEISGYNSLENLHQKIKHVTTLFERHKGYIDVNSNEELTQLLQSHDKELHKVIIKKELEGKVYLLKYKKVDEEDKYVISFTDITDEEQLVNINMKTGLSNIYAATADIEYRIDNNLSFVVDIIRIENIEQIVKWHGKDIRGIVDEKVAQVFKREKKRLAEHGVFVSYYGHNKFLLIRKKQMQGVVEGIVNKISLITAVEEDSVSEKANILYKPVYMSIEIQPGANIDNVIKSIDENFENILT